MTVQPPSSTSNPTTTFSPVTVSTSMSHSLSLVSPIQSKPKVPCVEITQENVTEMKVRVVEDGSVDASIDGVANISFPLNDASLGTSFLLGNNLEHDELLNSSGGEVVNLVATEGPDGKKTLVTDSGDGVDDNCVGKTQVQVMENELKSMKKNMEEIRNEGSMQIEKASPATPYLQNGKKCTSTADSSKLEFEWEAGSPFKFNNISRSTSVVISDMFGDSLENLQKRIEDNTEEPGGELVEYFEMRLKEFESEIVQGTAGEFIKKAAIDEPSVKQLESIATTGARAKQNSGQLETIATTDARAEPKSKQLETIATTAAMAEKNSKQLETNDAMTEAAIDPNNLTTISGQKENYEGVLESNEISKNAAEYIPELQSSTISEPTENRNRKKRRRDCPGTSWFGCSSKKQVKKRKVEEPEKAELNTSVEVEPEHFSQVSSKKLKRRSARLQSSPMEAVPDPSPPPRPVVGSIP